MRHLHIGFNPRSICQYAQLSHPTTQLTGAARTEGANADPKQGRATSAIIDEIFIVFCLWSGAFDVVVALWRISRRTQGTRI